MNSACKYHTDCSREQWPIAARTDAARVLVIFHKRFPIYSDDLPNVESQLCLFARSEIDAAKIECLVDIVLAWLFPLSVD